MGRKPIKKKLQVFFVVSEEADLFLLLKKVIIEKLKNSA